MKKSKRILIPLLLASSILISSCATAQPSIGSTNTDPADKAVIPSDTVSDSDKNTTVPQTDERYSYDAWVKNAYSFLNSIKNTDENGYITDDSSTLAWGTSYILDALYRGYCATGDIAFIESMSVYLYRIYELLADKDGDGYLNWGTAHYSDEGLYEEYAIHTSMLGLTAGEFVCLVYADPELGGKESPLGMTYREVADYLIDKTVNHLIPAFDRDWDEEAGVYKERDVERFGRKTLPHNQYLGMAVLLTHFAKVSPENSEEYIRKAEKMLNAFSDDITRYPTIGLMEWDYADPQFEGDPSDSGTEDFSHGMIDVRAAIVGYENGLVFSLHDIESFANNYATIMHRELEEYPALSDDILGLTTSSGVIYYWIYDMALYRGEIGTRGMTYMINTATPSRSDSAAVLVYHEDTPTPEEFSLAYPANGDTVDPDAAIFLWQRTACANYYCLQIAEDENFENIIFSRDKMPESSTIVKDLPENSTLYYRVTAKNMKGEETVSDVFSFTVKEGNK